MELFDRGHGQGGDGDGKEDGLGDIPVTTSVLGGGADDSVVDVSVLAGRRGYVHDAGTLQHSRRACVWVCVPRLLYTVTTKKICQFVTVFWVKGRGVRGVHVLYV